ncbi:MAG TPA: HAMP domain-containing sensor histidine kinase [Jiangellaceae bacterium]
MRRSLALLVAATTSLVLVAFLVPLAVLIRSTTADQAVSAAAGRAAALTPVVATSDSDTVGLALAAAEADTDQPFTVFYPDGSSVGAAAERSNAVELAATRGESLVADADGGRVVLVAVGLAEGTAVIQTFVSAAELSDGVVRTWLVLAVLGACLVALGVVVADRLARNLVGPVVEASDVSHRLAAGDLDARAVPGGPAEIREVAAGLNHLADRIGGMLREERESVADLSHRLRTPLTALRLEAEALPGSEQSDRIVESVDALERAVTQVISDARSRSDQAAAGGARCDAAAVIADRVAFWSVLAEDTDRRMDATLAPGPLPVQAAAADLAAAVDVLLGNVFAHTPDGTAFEVRLERRAGGGASVVVADAGTGFDQADVSRGASGAASTGLGLDIARRVAESSGGAFTIGRSAAGGAEVTLDLGGL